MISNDLLNVKEAYLALNEGYVVIDLNKRYFKLRNKHIRVKCENASYNLIKDEFLDLYKDSKFMIYEDNGQIIDTKKDDEYYNFKHK